MKIAKNGVKLSLTPSRNPVLTFGNETCLLIGDPHLGKRFVTGVPSHRLGEREESVYKQFKELLNQSEHTYIFVCGDLFDKASMSTTVMFDTYNIIKDACNNNPDVKYVIYPGNHDLSKDSTKSSSYKVVREMLNSIPNLTILLEEQMCFPINDDKVMLYVDTYNPFEQPSMQPHLMKDYDPSKLNILLGHFDDLDLSAYSYIPKQEYINQFDAIISGHIHVPKLTSFEGGNVPLMYTGSMQPYSHGEDPDKEKYVTYTLEQIKTVNLSYLKDRCVRLIVPPNYNKGCWFECAAITYLAEDLVVQTEDEEDVEYESESYFDKLIVALTKNETIEESIKLKLISDLKAKVYDEST